MDNEIKLFCRMPKGVIIESIAHREELQQIIACTNKGVYTIDKAGNPKQVVDGPLPDKTTFTFTGMEFNQGDTFKVSKGCNASFQEDI